MGVFLTKNSSEMQKNHDLKTFFVLDAVADVFFYNSDGFWLNFGTSEPLKS